MSAQKGLTAAPDGETMTRDNFMARLAAETRQDEQPSEGQSPDIASETAPAPEGTTQAAETRKKPETLQELAERLELEVSDLYGIQFSVAEGDQAETHTLGELKDLLQQGTDYSARVAAFEESRVKAENELLRAKQDLAAIIGSLPADQLNAQVIERARDEFERYAEAERARTLDIIPAWKDEDARAKDREGIVRFMSDYGFTAGNFDALTDHRMLKLLRDSWQRHERIQQAMAKLEERKPKADPPALPAGRQKGKRVPVSDEPAATPSELRRRFAALT